MLTINYRASDLRAVLTWSVEDVNSPWLHALNRLMFDRSEDASQENAFTISLPWWGFASTRTQIFKLVTGYELSRGKDYDVSDEAYNLLINSKRALESHETAKNAASIPETDIRSRLRKIAFARELSPEQVRNVSKLASLPAAATFSVPGAGKTTEVLASFFLKAKNDERLLVIAPKNAFAAWDEQITECMPSIKSKFIRLRGGREKIAEDLSDDPQFALITYQQLVRVADIVSAHCAQFPTHVFLDESHQIKSGAVKQTAHAVLTLSHLAVGKLIMSGTPMPQSTEDLIPQLAFLYPGLPTTADNVVAMINPVYVRTNKKELGLPPVTRKMIQLPMAPLQADLYKLMKIEVERQARSALSIHNKQTLRSLGRSVSRLLQFISNPSLLASEIDIEHPDILAAVLAEGDGPKMKYVLNRARDLGHKDHKVIIWTSFARNVEYISERLANLGAVFLHDGVDAVDDDSDETREGKIKLFHDDPEVRVLVANPAAAIGGVSLHRVCHHALYLDRTFNAAHYLQSENRIHRFGLRADQATTIEIIECVNTVDKTVRARLNFKIGQMTEALNDSSLKPDPIPIDPINIEDIDEYSTGIIPEDIEALLGDIAKGE